MLISAGLALAGAAFAGGPTELPPAVRLHPSLGDTLRPDDLARLDLFTDVPGVRAVVFHPAPWGGYMARIRLDDGGEMKTRERNVPSRQWQEWLSRAERILSGGAPEPTPSPGTAGAAADSVSAAGGPPVVAGTDPADTASVPPPVTRLKVWPEVPLPPHLARAAPIDSVLPGFPDPGGRWYILLEAGYRRNVTDFREFFTDMGMLAVNVGRLTGPVMPFIAMEFGFGDLQDDFEDLSGDGRANSYGFSLGVLAKAPLTRRTSFYASGAYGYFIRSLQWGGVFYNPRLNTYTNGVVLEQKDWGLNLRAGIQIQRRSRGKPRFYDIGVGVQTSVAEEWLFYDEESRFRAADRDTWVTLSVRFGESL